MEGIGSWLTRRSRLYGEKTAIVYGDRRISYGELNVRVNSLANALLGFGVRRGDRVAAFLMNGNEILEGMFACAKLGAIFVPVNFRLSENEVEYILHDSSARVFIYHESLSRVADEVRRRTEIPVAIRVGHGMGELNYERLLEEAHGTEPGFEVDSGEMHMMMYTSGTTGRPKGTMLTHANTQWNAINAFLALPLLESDITLTVAPLFHIGAMNIFTTPLLYKGGTVVIQDQFGPSQVLAKVERERVTTLFLVPAMWLAITQLEDFDRHDLSSLRLNLSGGAPCPLTVIEFFQQRGMPFVEGFGLTETAPIVSVLDDENTVRKNGSVGRPVFHVDTRIVDDMGNGLPEGDVGELLLRGPNVASGYWNKPEATREAMRGGWFYTGDLAREDDEGFLYIVDRAKDMLISGGENVYPVEIEQELFRHPKIREVAVVGVADDNWGEVPMAFVALHDVEKSLTLEELGKFCEGKLARFKIPKRLEIMEELPRNAAGKVLKTRLREASSLVGEIREG